MKQIDNLTDKYLYFYNCWVNKANSNKYEKEELHDVFDKFITIYIIFNYLYTIGTILRPLKLEETKENQKATKNAKKMLPRAFCIDAFIEENIKNLAKNLEDYPDGIKDIEKTFKYKKGEFLNSLKSEDNEKKLEATLQAIYKTRCNLFHGGKAFEKTQTLILIPCIEILIRINNEIAKFLFEGEYYKPTKERKVVEILKSNTLDK